MDFFSIFFSISVQFQSFFSYSFFIKSRSDFGFLPKNFLIDPDGKKKIFSSRSKLHRHLLTHQDKEHQNRCPKCCALFQSTLAEITHNCTASRQRVLIFHCPMCQYNCNKAVALKSHMLTHQPQKTPGFFCPHCDNFNCTRRSELSRHIERKHKGNIFILCPRGRP